MSAEMQSLMVLNLDCCSKINSFPKFTRIMKSLSELSLGGTAIKKVTPSSIECLRSLEKLHFYGCSKLKSLPRLPSTIRVIDATFCDFLKWSLAWVKLSCWSQPLPLSPYDERGILVEFKIFLYFLQVISLSLSLSQYKYCYIYLPCFMIRESVLDPSFSL